MSLFKHCLFKSNDGSGIYPSPDVARFENCFFWNKDTPEDRGRWGQWIKSLPEEDRKYWENYPPWQ